MRYLTPRKAAAGLGASGRGTAEHWSLTVSAVALAILTPLVIGVVAPAIGLTQAGVVAHFSRPYPAIVTGLFAIIGMAHWIRGSRILIDDYVEDPARPWVLIASQVFGWAVIAIAVFALAGMALASISA